MFEGKLYQEIMKIEKIEKTIKRNLHENAIGRFQDLGVMEWGKGGEREK